jgi:replicative DNA helicase
MISVEFVEKALIGSLLNDITRRDDVSWLRDEDFINPLCRAIWRHLGSGNRPRCQPLVDLVEMSDVLGRDYELHAMLRGLAELATLKVQAPDKPAVAEYGRILIEATIRREVAAMGLRLEHLASGQPEQIINGVVDALASLEGLDQRWQFSMGRRAGVDVDLPNVGTPFVAERFSKTTGPSSEGRHTEDKLDQQLAQKAVVGAAVHDWPPGARARVLEAVSRDDFADPRAAATWRAVEHLAEHDASIDEITVAWQALRTSSRWGDGLRVQELRETRSAALFHEAGAATLARTTLARVARGAKASTTGCSDDQGIDLATVLESAAAQHVSVASAARRLTGGGFPNESAATGRQRFV